jgi:hypothetical protein
MDDLDSKHRVLLHTIIRVILRRMENDAHDLKDYSLPLFMKQSTDDRDDNVKPDLFDGSAKASLESLKGKLIHRDTKLNVHVPSNDEDYLMSDATSELTSQTYGRQTASGGGATPLTDMSHSPPLRYSTSTGRDRRDPRYYNSQGVISSSSAIPSSVYAPQSQYYNPTYPPGDHRSPASPLPHTHFIPVAYPNYSHQMSIPRFPTVPPPENYRSPSLDYHVSSHIPSHHSHSHRSRILTGRPRTVSSSASTSPISASSPSGERFPCDKCGKTFSRSHDRRRHHETQHLTAPLIHRCRYCEKEFSRSVLQPCTPKIPRSLIHPFRTDSLKRHLDNGCNEMP